MNSKLPLLVAILLPLFAYLGHPSSSSKLSAATGGFSTTGFTGGVTGGGFTSSGNTIRVVNVAEHKDYDTFAFNTGTSSWGILHHKHTVGVQYHSDPWTYTGTPASNVASITFSQSIYVEPGTEWGLASTAGFGNIVPAIGVNAYGGNISSGNDLIIQTSDSSAIPSGRTLTFWIREVTSITYNDGTPPYSPAPTDTKYELELDKLACDDASITTRKTYGQPNKTGEIPADANAPLREINYGTWDYKGGIFVGNMPAGGKDASGTSRLDLFVNGGSSHVSTYKYAALSLFDRGKPATSGLYGDIDLGVYCPDSGDSLLGTITESNARWDYNWTISAGAWSSSSTDYKAHPISHQTLYDGDSGDYICMPLTRAYNGTPPATCLTALCVAITDESSATSSTLWHYFASKEYQDTMASYPRNDCAPRVWVVEQVLP